MLTRGAADAESHGTTRFCTAIFECVTSPAFTDASSPRRADVDELAWREALVRAGGPDNPDRLWPVLATGMGDLLQREAAQRAALDEHQARLEQVARGTRELASRQRTVLQQRLEAVKRREVREHVYMGVCMLRHICGTHAMS